jgi:hypothetical protein
MNTCIGIKDDGTICGKRITRQFTLCADCEKKYGKSRKDWKKSGNDWIIYLDNQRRNGLKTIKKLAERELQTNDFDAIEPYIDRTLTKNA